MKIVADIHLHSHFSRATSKNLNLEHLYKWAQLKGIQVVGTGDIAHPGWLQEMKSKLEPAEDGLFRLKEEFAKPIQSEVPKSCNGTTRFMLAGEISNIYKKNDKVRKIHNVVFLPSFDSLEVFQARLEKIGNIRSDGRPILGLDSRDLLEIVLETDPQGYLIPAHIWTPWFALFGSMSGFDSIEECFGDLTEHIFALETGLSSDPPMNWRLSHLDKYTLVSNSDAHSPPKLAREANVFDTELSYSSLFHALKTGDEKQFLGTIEFFPEEGKYHYDGHRKCQVRWSPEKTIANNRICPECGKEVTIGVMHRVASLADREYGQKPEKYHPYKSLIPLPEVLSEIYSVGVNSKRVNHVWEYLLAKLGPELDILESIPLEDIEKLGGSLLSEAIRRMRNGEVNISAGYDGEYGIIKIFNDQERGNYTSQLGFFENTKAHLTKQNTNKKQSIADKPEGQDYAKKRHPESKNNNHAQTPQIEETGPNQINSILAGLNDVQKAAAQCTEKPVIIVAGPGTGKTLTLTCRIALLIERKQAEPREILAVTFTNKAAQEMKERLQKLIGAEKTKQITIKTFHGLGAFILREHADHCGLRPNFSICSEDEQVSVIKRLKPLLKEREIRQILDRISHLKNRVVDCEKIEDVEIRSIFESYQQELANNNLVDYDDLICHSVSLFKQYPDALKKYTSLFKWISIDEFQDINFGQYELVRLLLSDEANLCVIGDPNQAIYGFRGADRKFFQKFSEDFPEAEIIKLSKNFRSTQVILDASSQVISQSPDYENIELLTEIVSKAKIEIYTAATDKAEAEYVVHEIEKMVGGTSYFSLDSGRVHNEAIDAISSFRDFAVLYRVNAQNRLLIEAFDRSGIPYQTVSEKSLYEHPEVRRLLYYLKFVSNPDADTYLEGILATQGKLSKVLRGQANPQGPKARIPLWHAIQRNSFLSKLAPKQRAKTRQLIAKLNEIHGLLESVKVSTLIKKTIELFYPENYFTEEKRAKLLERLLLMAKPFGMNLNEFLESAALHTENDEYDDKVDKVSLMTLHAAKGLEFPVVFIVGCEEKLVPYQRQREISDLEEERRLLYVGMTRAQNKLILMNAKKRFIFGEYRQEPQSRFLSAIENALKEIKIREFKKVNKSSQKRSQMDLF